MEDLEIHYKLFHMQKAHLYELESNDYLFLGDSYFEFFLYKEYAKTTFYERFDNKRFLNLGVAGSTTLDWLLYKDEWTDLPSFKNVVINLGYNDLHSNQSIDEIFKYMHEFIALIRKIIKPEKIYFFNITYSPLFKDYEELEKEYNQKFVDFSNKENFKILSLNDEFKPSYFCNDLAHPNAKGYETMYNILKENI